MRREWLVRTGVLVLNALLALGLQGQEAARFVIDGSTGVMPLAAALVEAFQERNPAITVEMGQGLGTGARIQALAEGRIDIALASHGLKLDDLARQGLLTELGIREDGRRVRRQRFGACRQPDRSGDLRHLRREDLELENPGGAERDIAPRTRPDSEVDAEAARANI